MPHRSIPVKEPTHEGQCYYNLSTVLSSRGEFNVDPKICKDSSNPIVYDSYSYNDSISVYSGTNAGYYNRRAYSARITDGHDVSVKYGTHTSGENEKALTVIAYAYGGLGAAQGAAQDEDNAKAAQTLYKLSTDTGCKSADIQIRKADSAEAISSRLASAYDATPGESAGGSS